MAESLGQAQLQLTVAGYDDLIEKLANIKKELNGISTKPIKLQVDGTGTRSKTTSGERAQGGARESTNALTNAKKTRYRLDQQIQTLERAGLNTSKLRAQLGEATTAQARRQFGSFKQIAGSLQFALTKEKDRLRVQKELNVEKAKDTRVRPISFDGGARESLTAKTDAQSKRARLNQQLNSLEASGVKTTKLRAQLGEATTAQANRQFGTFNQIANKLSDSLRAEREKLKIQRQQTREREKQVTEEKRIGKDNASPVSGSVRQEGSPAFNAARDRRNRASALEGRRIGALNASPVGGGAAFRGSPKANSALDAEGKRIGGLNASPVRGGVAFPGSPIALEVAARAENNLIKARQKAAEATIKTAAAEGKRLGGLNASPVRGGVAFPGSPIARETEQRARQKRRDGFNKKAGDVASNTLIGGGFPLLFGQGGGAAAGGALGGAVGGLAGGGFGFAGSIVGTALGAAFDTALEKGKALALGLDDPIGQFDKLREAALFSSLAVEKQVGALIDTGRTEEAKIAAQNDLNATFGGADNAREFAAATDELNRAWAQASVAVANFSAGPLTELITKLNTVLTTRAKDLKEGAAEEKAAKDLANKNSQNKADLDRRLKEKGLTQERPFQLFPSMPTSLDPEKDRRKVNRDFNRSKGVDPAIKELKEKQAGEAQLAQAAKRNLDINKTELEIIKAQASGNRSATLELKEKLVILKKTKDINSLGDTSDKKIRTEGINVQANKELADIDAERAKIQKDLNQALSEEFTRRAAIATQIKQAVLGQEAALARADAGANPGNSVLAARAGRAEGDAFKSQNQSGINAAKDNESQLRNQLRFEVDPSKQTELVSKIKTAAEATKLAYIEAGTALAEKIGAAAASLKGARDSLRNTLEGNIDLLPGQDVQNLRNMAQADINRGQRNGILRSDLAPADTQEEQFRRAGFVRSVENQTAQIRSQEALIASLDRNTEAEKNITVQVQLNGSPVSAGDRTASTL